MSHHYARLPSCRATQVMNLSEWAHVQGVHPQTAYRWFRAGTLPVPARQIGRLILVGDLEVATSQRGSTAMYARVSSADQRADLDRQVSRVGHVTRSFGRSRRNRNRLRAQRHAPKVSRSARRPDRDDDCGRTSRALRSVGSEYVVASLAANGRQLVELDDAQVDDDLVRDMTEVLTSFCARRYGRRAGAHRAARTLAPARESSGGA